MPAVPEIVTLAGDRIERVVQRATPIARAVALLSTACGALAYLVGALVLPGSWRIGWLVVGLLLCFAPAWSVWSSFRRLRRAATSVLSLPGQLAGIANDRAVRNALIELADRDEDPSQVPLVRLGKDLNTLRSATSAHRSTLRDLWETITALTSLPGLLALGIVGSIGLLVLTVILGIASLFS